MLTFPMYIGIGEVVVLHIMYDNPITYVLLNEKLFGILNMLKV